MPQTSSVRQVILPDLLKGDVLRPSALRAIQGQGVVASGLSDYVCVYVYVYAYVYAYV